MGFFTHFRQRQLDAANAAVAHHDSILECYLDRLDAGGKAPVAERCVTVLARSAASPALRALIHRHEALKARGVRARAIVAYLEPGDALRETVETLVALAPERKVNELLRWANKTCIHDAHEQLTLGTGLSWSGDMMRREPGKCDGLDLFEKDAPQTVRLGRLAFEAIWTISAPLPASRLRPVPARQGAAYTHRPGDALPTPPFLRLDMRPPLVRH